MLKNQAKNYTFYVKSIKKILVFICSLFFVLFFYFIGKKNERYSFFIEFNDANGIIVGTPVRTRGIIIGLISNVQLKRDCVLALVTINSKTTVISKDSIIETTQTGLLNESVIDIIPVNIVNRSINYDPLSSFCDSSAIICSDMYVLGNRGLNYDDLVRSTTRISQRFDDPRFFYLFYSFLQYSIDLTDSMSSLVKAFFYHFDMKIKIASNNI